MISFTSKLLLTLTVSTLVLGAPINPLDAATLLKNGQSAQQLNVAYQTLNATDACVNGDKACLSDGVAACQNATWVLGQGACSVHQACFALPSTQTAGTFVTCTTEKSALSAINATGATGGIFGNSTTADASASSSTDTSTTDSSDDGDGSNAVGGSNDSISNMSTTPTSTRSHSRHKHKATITPSPTAPGTVTITMTVGDVPTTLAPVTRTLSPEKASSLLSAMMASGATIINPPSATVATSSFSAPSSNATLF